MKLVVQVKLLPSAEQAAMLKATLRHTNAACDWLSEQAWTTKAWGQYALHKAAYTKCRAAFPVLSAQVVVRAIAKVADAHKLGRESKRTFRPLGSIAYDARILSWKKGETVSIWTVSGRQHIPFVCGDHQRELLQFDRGETDLVLHKGKFYLFVTVDVPDTEERKVLDWLGVDVGIVNIATTSDGEIVYKAKRAGVPVRHVDPRNTSRECRSCGHTEKRNRRTRDQFVCLSCGISVDADVNAACVIARRADVNRPYVGSVEMVVSHGANLQSPVL